MKNILSAILALVIAYFLMKVAFWMLHIAIDIAFSLISIVIMLLIALPVYIVLSRRVFR
jgi:hypothetical protein